MVTVTRAQARRFRWRVHRLQAGRGSARRLDDVPILDIGVQETGHAGASWSLACRGLDGYGRDGDASRAYGPDDVACVWTLRGAPHVYRRADLSGIAIATAPLDEADAAKRIFDAAKPLRQAGVPVLAALEHLARMERDIVTEPMVKGDVSGEMAARLDPPYLRACRPCGCVHPWENPFRLAALQAGLELQAGTAPPILRRIPHLRPRFFATPGGAAREQFDVVRGYLRFFGPALPKDAATFLDAPVATVTAHWPLDVQTVTVEGLPGARSVLAEDLPALTGTSGTGPTPDAAAGEVRLLGPYDPWLQARDRELLVDGPGRLMAADGPRRRKALWPVLGRPGAIAVDGDILGLWRPTSSGARLTLRVEAWQPFSPQLLEAVGGEAERLAAHRGQRLAAVTVAG